MQPAPEAISRGPPKSYIIDGERFYNVQQAAQVIEAVSIGTLWLWAKKGVTSFGFELDIRSVPMIHHARAFRHEARTHRQTRMCLPAKQVYELREIMRAIGRIKPERNGWTQCERDALQALTRRYRTSQLAAHHL